MPPFIRQRRTVRRDLAEMAQKGLLERVRGGATLISGASQDAPLLVRTQRIGKEKIAAGLALDFLEDNMTVIAGFQLYCHLSGCSAGQVKIYPW